MRFLKDVFGMEIFDFGFLYKLSKKKKNKRTMQEKMQKEEKMKQFYK